MTGILDRIRNTTVADLDKVSGDFSDLAPAPYRPRVAPEMIRTVKGATDLQDAMPVRVPSVNAGTVRTDGSGTMDNRPFKGQPTERQRAFMASLMLELVGLDFATWEQGQAYMVRMDAAEAWNPGRGENASRWIDSLKKKVETLKAAAPVAPMPEPVEVADPFDDVPKGYYALTADGITKFYRVTKWEGRTYLKIQASDEFHPIRNRTTKAMIIDCIRKDIPGAMASYGQHIGRCGRCHRTLTDELSRSRGIGPDCWGKM